MRRLHSICSLVNLQPEKGRTVSSAALQWCECFHSLTV